MSSPRVQTVPGFEQRFEDIETVTLVPPKVAVYRLTAGGVLEEVQDWSDSARRQLVAALESRVQEIGRLSFVPYPGPAETGDEDARADGAAERTPLEENWALFEAVASAIQRHVYDTAELFPHRRKNFDYTLGSGAVAVVEGTGADAFLLVVASDHVASGGRQALIGLGVLAGAFTGFYAGPNPSSPATVIVALVEAMSGDILWFSVVSSDVADLRDSESDEKLVDLVMKGLSED